jgi:hypothetical protein
MGQRGHLRASDADREHVAERLRNATAEGRLAAHELEQRLGVALSAQTYRELNATVADIPGPRHGGPRRGSSRALAVARAHPIVVLFALPVIITAFALAIAVTVLWTMLVVLAALLFGDRRRPTPPWIASSYARGHAGRGRRSAASGLSPWL